MNSQQANKMLIIFLMMKNPSADFDQPFDSTRTYRDVIKQSVADIPGSSVVIDAWVDLRDPNIGPDRTNTATAVDNFLSTNGNRWGGGPQCPTDVATMVGWLLKI